MSDSTQKSEDKKESDGKEKRKKQKREAEKKLVENKVLSPEEEINQALSQSSIGQKQKHKRSLYFKGGLYVLGALLFVWLLFYLFAPFKGSMAYGVCKVFLEQHVEYPMHLRLSQVEEFDNWVRIWHTKLDAYGEYRLEPIQCFFRLDETYGYVIDRVFLGDPSRPRVFEEEVVARFNKTLPVILQNPPDLTMPRPLPDALENLRFDYNPFVRPIF